MSAPIRERDFPRCDAPLDDPVYRSFDGKPMSDNADQWDWMVRITAGLKGLFRDRPDVFVAGDLLWYPVEGKPKVRVAPDAMVVFGRPKGARGSYIQFREEGVAPQVVFKVLSPKNTKAEMGRKRRFYERHGVEEYYLFDPATGGLWGWVRDEGMLRPVAVMNGWTSPRLGVRFLTEGRELRLIDPRGRVFLTPEENAELLESTSLELERSREERSKEARRRRLAEQARDRAGQARDRAEQARDRAEEEKHAALLEARRNAEVLERLRERLRDAGLDPDS